LKEEINVIKKRHIKYIYNVRKLKMERGPKGGHRVKIRQTPVL
jgi:hypothetical protein